MVREQILNLHSPISFLLSLSQMRDILEELGLDVAVMENFHHKKVGQCYSNSRSFQPGAVFSHFTFQADFHFGISFYYQNTITG